MGDDAALLLPIGHGLGPIGDPAGARLQRVRLGARIFTLDGPGFGVWALAHGAPHRSDDRVWGRGSVLGRARELGLPDPAAQLETLLADGLLVEVTPGDGSVAAFAARHRLVPLMLGLGNTAEEPDVYRIGLPGRPIVAVGAALYEFYGWSHLDPALAVACEFAAERERRSDPDGAPTAVADALLATIHALLAPNAAYLDQAFAA
jgi:hypothetical protein